VYNQRAQKSNAHRYSVAKQNYIADGQNSWQEFEMKGSYKQQENNFHFRQFSFWGVNTF